MQKLTKQIEDILDNRFGKDSLIALATVENGLPYVRTVDSYYDNGAFYILTYARSNKMVQIEKNPVVAISGEWFTAHGTGRNLGWFCLNENKEVANKMRELFASWIDNGHCNFEDENTCILCVKLTDGILYSNGKRYDIDFSVR